MKGNKLTLTKTLRTVEVLRELAPTFEAEHINYSEAAARIEQVCGFTLTTNNLTTLRKELGIQWRVKMGPSPKKVLSGDRLFILVDTLRDLMMQMGVAMTPEFKALHDQVKEERANKEKERDSNPGV